MADETKRMAFDSGNLVRMLRDLPSSVKGSSRKIALAAADHIAKQQRVIWKLQHKERLK